MPKASIKTWWLVEPVTAKPRLVVVTEQMNSPHGTQMLASLVIDQAVSAGFEVVLFTPKFDPERSSSGG